METKTVFSSSSPPLNLCSVCLVFWEQYKKKEEGLGASSSQILSPVCVSLLKLAVSLSILTSFFCCCCNVQPLELLFIYYKATILWRCCERLQSINNPESVTLFLNHSTCWILHTHTHTHTTTTTCGKKAFSFRLFDSNRRVFSIPFNFSFATSGRRWIPVPTFFLSF